MFGKLKIVLLALVVFCGGFIYGYFSYRNKLFPYGLRTYINETIFQSKPHNVILWSRAREADSSQKMTSEQSEEISKLTTLGYLSGYKKAPSAKGVVVNNRKLTYNGYNFYTSGHAPEAILMDMEGNVLHTWSYEGRNVWPEKRTPDQSRGWWRRADLFDNGEVLAIFDYHGLIKLDKDSNLLWSYANGCHHDLQVMNDGRIYVLTSELKSNSHVREGDSILEDYITVLNANGKLIERISIIDAFGNSKYAPLLDRIPLGKDIFHTNTIEVLDGRLQAQSAAFKAGNVLISLRNIDVIAVIDMELEKVVWALSGMWKKQHQPTVLNNGNILLFDNQGNHGHSKVIEFNPFTQEVVWEYPGDETSDFSSFLLGSNQRLPNGNTLITESTFGRALEVTPDKKIVWEFLNPKRAGQNNELIAVVSDMVRMEPDLPLDWLK